jgi:hypothetical protein
VSPKVSERYQGNLLCAGISRRQPSPLTVGEVISEVPLSRIATYIRQITSSVDERLLQGVLATMAPVKDKSTVYLRLDSLPPLSLAVTDWRRATMCDHDFGIGKPVAAKQIADTVNENMVMIYPQRRTQEESDQGLEVVVPFEKHAVDMLIEDPDMKKIFEFGGFEAGGTQ